MDVDQIICADAIAYLRSLPDECVDLCITSPPYFNARPEYATWATYKEYLGFMRQIIGEINRVLKAGCFFALNTSPVIVPRKSRQYQSRRLAIPFHLNSIAERQGFWFIDDIIWRKPDPAAINRTAGFNRHRRPMAYKPNIVTEYLMVYRKKSPHLIDMNIRSHDSAVITGSLVEGEYERTNIWDIAPSSSADHPAIFPDKLAAELIRYYSFKGDVVLDPFMGSGTTALVARWHKRHYVGCDLNPKYVAIAQRRLRMPFDPHPIEADSDLPDLPMFQFIQAQE